MALTLDDLRSIGAAFLDAYVVVDAKARIVAFNRQFFALFPKTLARRLEGQSIEAVLRLDLGEEELDIVDAVLQRQGPVRYDEVVGYVTDGPTVSFIASAVPLAGARDPSDAEIWGVLVLLRDVTDVAEVQAKYQRMLSAEARDRSRLEEQIAEQGKRLLELGATLAATERELASYQRQFLL